MIRTDVILEQARALGATAAGVRRDLCASGLTGRTVGGADVGGLRVAVTIDGVGRFLIARAFGDIRQPIPRAIPLAKPFGYHHVTDPPGYPPNQYWRP
jgi:hypothetical protein